MTAITAVNHNLSPVQMAPPALGPGPSPLPPAHFRYINSNIRQDTENPVLDWAAPSMESLTVQLPRKHHITLAYRKTSSPAARKANGKRLRHLS